jgi:hypothetical protein
VAFEGVLIAFIVAGLLFFISLWLYYDRRDKIYYDRQRIRHIHHCVKCGTLYSTHEEKRQMPCPACGFGNPPLHF